MPEHSPLFLHDPTRDQPHLPPHPMENPLLVDSGHMYKISTTRSTTNLVNASHGGTAWFSLENLSHLQKKPLPREQP